MLAQFEDILDPDTWRALFIAFYASPAIALILGYILQRHRQFLKHALTVLGIYYMAAAAFFLASYWDPNNPSKAIMAMVVMGLGPVLAVVILLWAAIARLRSSGRARKDAIHGFPVDPHGRL